MMAKPNWIWVGGWGMTIGELQSVAQQFWPHADHRVLPPTEKVGEEVLQAKADRICGYSLGTLVLMASPVLRAESLTLFAPILAFDAEAGAGGRTPRRSRLGLMTRFARDPLAAVNLYRRLAGLPGALTELPYAEADLAWGMDALGNLRFDDDRTGAIRGFVGEADALVDTGHAAWAAWSFERVPLAGHALGDLLGKIPPP